MASFNGFVLTNKGRELLAKAVAGEQLTFTKMEVGDGNFTGDIKTLAALISKKDDFNINQIENQGNGQVLLKAIINNQNTTTGYYIREIGIFAYGVDNIEVLYAYNKAIEADYFPAFNSSNVVEVEYQNYIIVDQAQNITAAIDPSLTYITKEEATTNYVLKSQIATETEAGVMTKDEIRQIAAETLGNEYKGKFGSTLTSIEKDKIYYYFDSTKNIYVPYKALKTATNSSGFLAPDTTNFVNISNDYINNRFEHQNAVVHASAFATGYLNLSKKSNIALLDLNNIKMTTGAVGTPIAYVTIPPSVRVFFNVTNQNYGTLRMAIDTDGKVYNLDENTNINYAFSGQAIIF